jgi:hypothetical protein
MAAFDIARTKSKITGTRSSFRILQAFQDSAGPAQRGKGFVLSNGTS